MSLILAKYLLLNFFKIFFVALYHYCTLLCPYMNVLSYLYILLLTTQPPARLVWDHLEFLLAEIQYRNHLSSCCISESAGLWENCRGQRAWRAQREMSRKGCLGQAACGCPRVRSLLYGNRTSLFHPGEWVEAHSHTGLLRPQMTASYWPCKSSSGWVQVPEQLYVGFSFQLCWLTPGLFFFPFAKSHQLLSSVSLV